MKHSGDSSPHTCVVEIESEIIVTNKGVQESTLGTETCAETGAPEAREGRCHRAPYVQAEHAIPTQRILLLETDLIQERGARHFVSICYVASDATGRQANGRQSRLPC